MGFTVAAALVVVAALLGELSSYEVTAASEPVVSPWHTLDMPKELTLYVAPRKQAPLGVKCQVCWQVAKMPQNCTVNSTVLHLNRSGSVRVAFTCANPEKHFAVNASLKYLFHPKHAEQVSMRVPTLPKSFPLSLVEVKWNLMLSTKGEEGSLEILFLKPRPSTIKPPSSRQPGGAAQASACDDGELHVFMNDWVANIMTVGSFCQRGAGTVGGLQQLLSRNSTFIRLLLPPRVDGSATLSAVQFKVSYQAHEIQDQYIVFYELGRNRSEVVQSAGWPRGVPDLMSGSWLVTTAPDRSRSVPDYATMVTFLNASAPRCRLGHVTMAVEPLMPTQLRHSLTQATSWREDDVWPHLVGLSSETFYLNFSNCKMESGSLSFKALIEPGAKPPPPDSKAAMIGGIVGGVVASVLLIILVAVCCICKKRRKAPATPTGGAGAAAFCGEYEGFVSRAGHGGRMHKPSDSSIYEVIPDEAVYSFYKTDAKNPASPNGQEQLLTDNELYRAFQQLPPPPLPSRNTASSSIEMVTYDLPPVDDHHEDDRAGGQDGERDGEREGEQRRLHPAEPLLNQGGVPEGTDQAVV